MTGTDFATDLPAVDPASVDLEAIHDHELPDAVREVVEVYERVEPSRDRFLWRWNHVLAPSFTLPSVAAGHEERVVDHKVLTFVFTTLLDDLVEVERDHATFEQAAKVPFDHARADPDATGVRDEYLAVTRTVWDALECELRESPRYDRYSRWLAYDVEQLVNSMRYAGVVNDDPHGSNATESERFDAYNMAMFPCADLDLMHSSGVDHAEWGAVREVVDRCQRMARIGNWLSTWQRELAEGDVSAGVVASAIVNGVVTPRDLERAARSAAARDRVVAAIQTAGIEADLERDWLRYRTEAEALAGRVDSIDLAEYVSGMNTVLEYQLAAEGLK